MEGNLEGKDQFDVARELIRHEDGLVNNRVTWLLVLQGFLFNAFVNGIGLLDQFKERSSTTICIAVGLVLICVIGIASSLTAANVVRIAFTQINQAKSWWKKTTFRSEFPSVAGELGEGWYYLVFSTGRMPFFLTGVWSLLILLLITGFLLDGRMP